MPVNIFIQNMARSSRSRCDLFRCSRQLGSASDGEHIQIENDFSKMIRGELRQAHLVRMMDTIAHVVQHRARKGWKSFATLLYPQLREAH